MLPGQPAPPAAVYVVIVACQPCPVTPGCTGSAGNLPAQCGILWSESEIVPSWPALEDLWSMGE